MSRKRVYYEPLLKFIQSRFPKQFVNNILKEVEFANNVLLYYQSLGEYFLRYTLNFGRNKQNILDHTFEYVIRCLIYIKPIIINFIVVPFTARLSRTQENINFLMENGGNIVRTDCKNDIELKEGESFKNYEFYIMYGNMFDIYNRDFPENDLYKHYNISDLVLSPVVNNEITDIVGIGYSIHDNYKKLKIVLNDSYINLIEGVNVYDYYFRDSPDKFHITNYLFLIGINHPLLYVSGNFYNSELGERFNPFYVRVSGCENRRRHSRKVDKKLNWRNKDNFE